MTLTPGTTIGPYRIERELGRGGMGQVYLANDSRLERRVAIKTLPEDLRANADLLARFQREARLLASLNHSGIAAIYGIEEAQGHQYLILEYVEGESLADRLARGALPVEEALALAKQIAEALEAAHERGVVHRDIKPSNVMLTRDGTAKVLDFGLARAADGTAASPNAALDGRSPSVVAMRSSPTIPGAILGTAGYMSPEQARGKPVDKRTDIFSFGCLLYEMLTGRGPFPGETITDSLAAVISHEPDWSALPESLGPSTRRVLARCLEKNPRLRYRDIGDVAFDLDAARTMDAAGKSETRSTRSVAWAVAAICGVAAVVLGALLWKRPSATSKPLQYERITYAPQFMTNARFTSDARTVVFSAARSGNTTELFVKGPQDAQPRTIGSPNLQLLSVSSMGELAVLVRCKYLCHRTYIGMLARMPLAGGAPREILDDVTGADWTPDGADLAVVRQVGPASRLEFPAGNVLWEAAGYISDLRLSRDGRRLAFTSHAYVADNRGQVVIIDLEGKALARSVEYWGVEGLAWSADGASVLYSAAAQDGETFMVRELTLDGSAREVLTDHTGIELLDVDTSGRLLATDYRITASVFARFVGADGEREFPWLGKTFLPVLSRDGRTLVFNDQSRMAGKYYSVCLQPTDGSPPARLGDGIAVDFAPDGASVLVLVQSEPPRMLIYPIGAGTSRDVSDPEFVAYDFTAMRYTADGRGVLYCGSRKGQASRAYLLDLASGVARPVTPEGTSRGFASPDGKSVVARDAEGRFQRYPLDGSAPTPVAGLDNDDYIVRFRPDGKSLIAIRPQEVPSRIESIDLETGRRTFLREIAPDNKVGAMGLVGMVFSDDEKSYAYSIARSVGELFTVEGVR